MNEKSSNRSLKSEEECGLFPLLIQMFLMIVYEHLTQQPQIEGIKSNQELVNDYMDKNEQSNIDCRNKIELNQTTTKRTVINCNGPITEQAC